MNKKEIAVLLITLSLVLILLLMIVFAFDKNNKKISNVNTKNNIEVFENNNQEIIQKEWNVFKDDELRIKFNYPSNYNVKEIRQTKLDKGKKKEFVIISESDDVLLTITATSKDYKAGIREGCCYNYSDSSLDLSLSISKLTKKIQDLKPVYINKIKIGDKNALEFFSIKNYITYSVSKSILIPFNKNKYTNILITGPILINSKILDNSNIKKEEIKILDNLKEKDYLNDKKIVELSEVYDKVLDSVKF